MLINGPHAAGVLRSLLVPLWTERKAGWTPSPNETASMNMCCYTSELVHMIDPRWSVVRGEVYGHRASPGRHDHAWNSDGFVHLDLTGDQFGYAPVIWCTHGGPPAGYVPDMIQDVHDDDVAVDRIQARTWLRRLAPALGVHTLTHHHLTGTARAREPAHPAPAPAR